MKLRSVDPAFRDSKGMLPGDSVAYDPSREGTGEWAEGTILTVHRYSLVIQRGDDVDKVGVTRVFTHRKGTRLIMPPVEIITEGRFKRKGTSFPL